MRRSIIRAPLFEDSIASLFFDAEEADEYTAAAEDVLSRDPQIGRPEEDGVWSLAMAPLEARAVYLFYSSTKRAFCFSPSPRSTEPC